MYIKSLYPKLFALASSCLFYSNTLFADSLDGCISAYKKGSYAEAARCYRSAAEQGNSEAQYNLGRMFRDGKSVHRDYSEAARWYRKSAEQGNAAAQFNLGINYYNGPGVTQSYKQAHAWFIVAASNGDTQAVNGKLAAAMV